MRAVIQRVKSAEVLVKNETIGKIEKGILVLLGITAGDDEADIQYLADKITNLRIFEGESGKMDLSVQDINGSILIVSQFTLYGSCRKGRRPDFGNAAPTEEAEAIYKKTIEAFKKTGIQVEDGEFQAYMQVQLENDGPVTLIIDSPNQP